MQSALVGGLFTGILSALPFVNIANCCCLWIIGGGVVAAYIEQQNSRQLSIGMGRGATLGLLAGVIGAIVWLLVSLAIDPLVGAVQSRFIGAVVRDMSDVPPNVRAALESLGSAPNAFQYALNFTLYLFAGMIFSTVGGILGAAFFRKDVPPALGGTYIPPLPPDSSGGPVP